MLGDDFISNIVYRFSLFRTKYRAYIARLEEKIDHLSLHAPAPQPSLSEY